MKAVRARSKYFSGMCGAYDGHVCEGLACEPNSRTSASKALVLSLPTKTANVREDDWKTKRAVGGDRPGTVWRLAKPASFFFVSAAPNDAPSGWRRRVRKVHSVREFRVATHSFNWQAIRVRKLAGLPIGALSVSWISSETGVEVDIFQNRQAQSIQQRNRGKDRGRPDGRLR